MEKYDWFWLVVTIALFTFILGVQIGIHTGRTLQSEEDAAAYIEETLHGSGLITRNHN